MMNRGTPIPGNLHIKTQCQKQPMTALAPPARSDTKCIVKFGDYFRSLVLSFEAPGTCCSGDKEI